tara:strand:+ start:1283 stop:1723 length:441 start_codon:yes stop_codon:yes gene_type:complete
MELAIEEAIKAKVVGEVPIGALVAHKDGEIISRAYNLTKTTYDPSAHAEINALRMAAKKVKNNILKDYDLYVTLEPCLMCTVAISNARIRRLYFGAYANQVNEFSSNESSRYLSSSECNHRPEIYGGILEIQNQELIKSFFQSKRF